MSEKCCCAGAGEKFKELQPVLDKYAKVPGSLITILQKTQEIYGYLSMEAINHISEPHSSLNVSDWCNFVKRILIEMCMHWECCCSLH